MTPSEDELLDNMAWFALAGPQGDLAELAPSGGAARYRRKVSPICGVEAVDDAGWAGLAELAGPGGYVSLFRADAGPAPSGWAERYRGTAIQYLSDELAAPPTDLGIVELGADDAEDMVALTELTEPGPFSTETWRTGRYFGLRRNGRLVAMAGERMRVDGWGEVSAVCVHPDGRGQGLGEALTLQAAAAIVERGDRAMLHVASGNDPAHRLYRRIGFQERRSVDVVVYRRDGERPPR